VRRPYGPTHQMIVARRCGRFADIDDRPVPRPGAGGSRLRRRYRYRKKAPTVFQGNGACCPESLERRAPRAPHRAMWRRCQDDTNELNARIRPPQMERQSQPFERHHATSQDCAARRRGQCPKPRTFASAVGAQRRGIDGAEHSARMARVMPVVLHNPPRIHGQKSQAIGTRATLRDKSRTAHEDKEGGRSRPDC